MAARASGSKMPPAFSGRKERSLNMRSFIECERAIPDHSSAVTRGVAGIAQIEKLRRQSALPRSERQTIDRRAAACLLVRNVAAQVEDGLGSGTIDRLRFAVTHVMRQIRAHDDERFCAAP